MVAWRIMSLIRERVDLVAVLIPQSAYSAATLVALGADEIIMHPNSHIGPVDMQIRSVRSGGTQSYSTEDISAFLDFVRDKLKISDQRHLRRLFEEVCKELGPTTIGFTARSSQLATALGQRLLQMHIKDDSDGSKSRALVETLRREFYSHSYPVSRKEAIRIDLHVNKDSDKELESLMWSVWCDLERELQERVPTSEIIELLSSSQAPKLLSAVPQLNLPCNAPGPNYLQSDLAAVQTACQQTQIDPVDWEHVDAILESEGLAFRGVRRGKILASRTPDLTIQYNRLVTFKGWEQRPIP
jgi:hypothetical protein